MADSIHKGHRERMKGTFFETGAVGFNRHQLIEMLLFFGIPQKDTNPLAHRLNSQYPSLADLFAAPAAELMNVEGMTRNAALLFRLCGELFDDCRREAFSREKILDSTEKMCAYVTPLFVGVPHERVVLVCLNHLGKVLGHGVISEGSVTAAEINLRNALQLALRYNATAVILAHNHPNGNALPSREDVDTTMAIAKGLAVADIRLIDHIVVADNDAVSMWATPIYKAMFQWNHKTPGALADGSGDFPEEGFESGIGFSE